MEQIQRSIENLITRAHSKQYRLRGVVQPHDGVATLIHEFVTSLALKTNMPLTMLEPEVFVFLPGGGWYASGSSDS